MLLLDGGEVLFDGLRGSLSAKDFVEMSGDEIVLGCGTAFVENVEEHLAVNAV